MKPPLSDTRGHLGRERLPVGCNIRTHCWCMWVRATFRRFKKSEIRDAPRATTPPTKAGDLRKTREHKRTTQRR